MPWPKGVLRSQETRKKMSLAHQAHLAKNPPSYKAKEWAWEWQLRPLRDWGLKLVFRERVGWHSSLFIQLFPLCLWVYWNPHTGLREYEGAMSGDDPLEDRLRALGYIE